MDLSGDIVEKDVDEVSEVGELPDGGFPKLYKPEKVSSWKARLKRKQQASQTGKVNELSSSRESMRAVEESAAQRIHRENLETMRKMSPEEIARERQELLESSDPKLIQKLLKNVQKSDKIFAEIEGASGTWVGGKNEAVANVDDLPPLDEDMVNRALDLNATELPKETSASLPKDDESDKQESEDQDIAPPLDDDDVAPLEFQVAQTIDHMANEDSLKDVHFVAPKVDENDDDDPLDINDPEFNEKLHKKFFPNLPKEVDKLKWMEKLPEDKGISTIEDVTQCRFDFKGNLVPPNRPIDNTNSGSHHHSEDQHSAGYTIIELAHLARSQFASQRAIAIRTSGRILYKLGKQEYNSQLTVEVNDESEAEDATKHIYMMFWDSVKDTKVIELLESGSDEKYTKSLSIRNYAIEALWLWKQGGGNKYKNK